MIKGVSVMNVNPFYQNHLNHDLPTASLNGQGIAISMRSKAIPKNSNVFLNFACAVSAFFTDTLPACTNIHAMIIIIECSTVKKRSMGSFMVSPIFFKLSNQPILK